MVEVLAAVPVDPGGAGAGRDDRVHRVGRREPQRRPPGPAERLQHLLQDLVGAVGRPHLRRPDRLPAGAGQVGGQVVAQRERVPVGVAVELQRRVPQRRAEVGEQLRRQRVRVLVGVEPVLDL
jgi:hypothetical protein